MLFNLCISGLPLFELTTLANTTDASVVPDILRPANAVLFLRECTFLGDKGYDVKTVYNLVKDAYEGEAVIPLNKRGTKNPEKLSVGNPICEAGLAILCDRIQGMFQFCYDKAAVSVRLPSHSRCSSRVLRRLCGNRRRCSFPEYPPY